MVRNAKKGLRLAQILAVFTFALFFAAAATTIATANSVDSGPDTQSAFK